MLALIAPKGVLDYFKVLEPEKFVVKKLLDLFGSSIYNTTEGSSLMNEGSFLLKDVI